MKKAIISFFFICCVAVIAVIVIVSCNKSYNSQSGAQSLNQLFAALRTTPQSVTVVAGRDTVIKCAKGTVLHFYSNTFKDANGNILTGCAINLQIVEMYRAADMVCNRATTMTADGQLLQSGGQVNITATMNGQEVYPNTYGIAFKHSVPSSSPMSLFYGGSGSPDSVITWTQSSSGAPGTSSTGTTDSLAFWASSLPYYSFDSCTVFHWANCDWFHSDDSPRVAVSVILPDNTFNPKNTELYLMLPFISSEGSVQDTVVAVLADDSYSYSNATNTIFMGSDGAGNALTPVPAGLHYELIVITNKNGSYSYYEQSGIIPHSGLVVTAAMSAQSPGDIALKLQGMGMF